MYTVKDDEPRFARLAPSCYAKDNRILRAREKAAELQASVISQTVRGEQQTDTTTALLL